MTTRIDFSDGEWVDLKDVSALRDGDRKAVNGSVKVEVTDDGVGLLPGDQLDRKRDALLARIIENWSFATSHGLPLPSVDISSLDKLSIRHARELHRAMQDHWDELFSDESPEKRGTVPTSA